MQSVELKSFLPENKVEAVRRGLQVAFSTTTVDEITPLGGGLSTALVYKIVISSKAYALRLVMHVDALNDPARQYSCMRIAADAGVAPHVYYTNVEDAISITEYVEVVPLSKQYPERRELLAALAQTLKQLHGASLFPKLVNFMDALDGFIAEYKAAPIFSADAADELFERYAQIQEYYPRHDPELVSSHNDLNYRNVIGDGKQIWIIDWEAAFQNDRYADLATIGNGYVNNNEEEETFLSAYFGDALNEVIRARYFLARQIRHLFYAMVMVRISAAVAPADWRYDNSVEVPSLAEFRGQLVSGVVNLDGPDGKLLFARVEMNEALRDMKSARFADAIRITREAARSS